MKKISLLIYCAIIVIIVGCGSSSTSGPDLAPAPTRKVVSNIPDWFINTPVNEGYRYSAATATSRDLQVAINKAELDAANSLAGRMESEMNATLERAREEVGLGADSKFVDSFKQVQEQIISKSLEDYDLVRTHPVEEKSGNTYIFRAYVLVEWDETAAQKKMHNELKANELLYDQMRATELYDEMQEKVEAYRDRKSLKNN